MKSAIMHFFKSRRHDDPKPAKVQRTSLIYSRSSFLVKHKMPIRTPAVAELSDENPVQHYPSVGMPTPPLTPHHSTENKTYRLEAPDLPTPPDTPRDLSPERQTSVAAKDGSIHTDGPQVYNEAEFLLAFNHPQAIHASSYHRQATVTPDEDQSAGIQALPEIQLVAADHGHTNNQRSSNSTASTSPSRLATSRSLHRSTNQIVVPNAPSSTAPRKPVPEVKSPNRAVSPEIQKSSTVASERPIPKNSNSRFSWGWIKDLSRSKNFSTKAPETGTGQYMPFSSSKSFQREKSPVDQRKAANAAASSIPRSERSIALQRPLTSGANQQQAQRNSTQFKPNFTRPSTANPETAPKINAKGKERTYNDEDITPYSNDVVPNGHQLMKRFPSLNSLDKRVMHRTDADRRFHDEPLHTQTRGRRGPEKDIHRMQPISASPDERLKGHHIHSTPTIDHNMASEPVMQCFPTVGMSSDESARNSLVRGSPDNSDNAIVKQEELAVKTEKIANTKSMPTDLSQAINSSDPVVESTLQLPEITLTREDIPLKVPPRPQSEWSVSTSKSVSFDPSVADSDRGSTRMVPRSMKRTPSLPSTSYQRPQPLGRTYAPSAGITTRPKSTVQYMTPHNESGGRNPGPKRLSAIEKQILQQASLRHLAKPKERKLAGFDPTPGSSAQRSSETSGVSSTKAGSPNSKRRSSLITGVLSGKSKERKSIDQSSLPSDQHMATSSASG